MVRKRKSEQLCPKDIDKLESAIDKAKGHAYGDLGGPRPNHTNDNYLDYYVGDYNGAVAADRDDNAGGDDGTSNHCGSGHTQEYCIGHKAGYSVEAYLLNDA